MGELFTHILRSGLQAWLHFMIQIQCLYFFLSLSLKSIFFILALFLYKLFLWWWNRDRRSSSSH